MIGQTILHYEITDKLGAGGMGEVFLATDTKLDRQVALKFLPEVLQRNPEARERLLREARAISKLSHPNIVTVYAVEHVDGRDFIVMQYIDGLPLDECCLEHDPRPDEILGMVIGMASGLVKAHEAGIVHRDLKPSNVLVDSDRCPHILDFGLAKVAGSAKLTQTGSTVGTVAYMSPEQGRGDETDHRSDIFSFGVILYQLITRQTPFAGDHDAAILYAIANEEPEPLARYKSDVPEDLQRIITKCLAKSPADRYQSAADLVTDLKLVKKTTGTGTPKSLSGTETKPKARAGLMISSAAVLLVALAVFVFKPSQIIVEPTHEAVAAHKTLAVLPFENLGSEEDEYFADGITDEINSRLARIPGLRVISRTSSMYYKGTDKDLRTIGSELGVDYIINGTIRWDKSGDTSIVRITPQLINVSEDFSVWSESYERSLVQIFAVQSEIAEQIASALNISFLESGGPTDIDKPTESLAAYDSYLRGLEYFNRGNNETELRAAITMFENAISLDSGFALACAKLAYVQASLHFQWERGMSMRWQDAEESVARAFALQPHLPEAHLAKGVIQNLIYRQYDSALASFARAEEGMGNPSDLYSEIAGVKRRQGEWLESLDNYKKAVELDPRSPLKLGELADMCRSMRRHEEAIHYSRRAIALAPDNPWGYMWLVSTQVAGGAEFAEIRNMLKEASTLISPGKVFAQDWDFPLGFYRLGLWDQIKANPEAIPRDYYYSEYAIHDYYRAVGQIYLNMSEPERAHIFFDSARADLIEKLDEHHQMIEETGFRHQNDFMLHAKLGTVYAYLEEKELAVQEGLRGVELMPNSDCFW